MRPRICICCGETMSETGNLLSRNPNVCASCSSLADGMDDSSLATVDSAAPEVVPQIESPPGQADCDEVTVEWVAGESLKHSTLKVPDGTPGKR
jgi:hypothetical protein